VPERVDTPDGDGARAGVPWSEIAESAEFRRLLMMRRRAMLVTLGIFGVVFGTFLVLSGYARPFMSESVDGGLTVAYVWILGLTVLAWVLVWAYLRVGSHLEAEAHEMLRRGGYGGEERR